MKIDIASVPQCNELEIYKNLVDQGYEFEYKRTEDAESDAVFMMTLHNGKIIGATTIRRICLRGISIKKLPVCEWSDGQTEVNELHRGKRIMPCMYLLSAIVLNAKLHDGWADGGKNQSPSAKKSWDYLRANYPEYMAK